MSYNDLKDCKIYCIYHSSMKMETINFDALPALIEHLFGTSYRWDSLAGNDCRKSNSDPRWGIAILRRSKIVNGRVPLTCWCRNQWNPRLIEFVPKKWDAAGGFAAGLAIVPITINHPKKECITFKALVMHLILPIIISIFQGAWVVVKWHSGNHASFGRDPNIIGVKECTTSLANMVIWLKQTSPEEFHLYREDGDVFHAMNSWSWMEWSQWLHTNGDEKIAWDVPSGWTQRY